MKRIMIVAVGVAAMLACAVTVPEKTPEQRRAEMEKFGGYVKRPGNGKSVLLADMRSEKKDDGLLQGFAKGGAAIMHLTFDLKAAKPPTGKDIGEAARQLKDASHPAVVAVADVPAGDIPRGFGGVCQCCSAQDRRRDALQSESDERAVACSGLRPWRICTAAPRLRNGCYPFRERTRFVARATTFAYEVHECLPGCGEAWHP